MTSKPKIIHVSAYYPPSLGGLEKVVEYLAVEQARTGHSVEVVTSNVGYDATYSDKKVNGYKVSRLAGAKIANVPIIPGLLFRLLAQPVASVLHCHVAQAFVPEIALIAARLRRSKFIIHFHVDAAASGPFGFLFSLYKKLLFPLTLRRANAIIVFSDAHASLVMNKYGVAKKNVHVVPNGVAPEFFYDSPRTIHEPARLLFVGRLEAQKNVGMLIDSLSHVTSGVTATLVGSGDKQAELSAKVKTSQFTNVHFVGRKNGPELLSLYKNADIFVLTSDREGMPLVLLEAMAMGLPIVATNVEGTRDVVKQSKTGLLVGLNDAHAFAKAVDTLVHDPDTYQSMSRSARSLADEYSWGKVAIQVGGVYDTA